ncbi:MAG: peptidoglycan DD-metalloendopeptidase family protein [Patescibacteria group bacterium]|nr:peptidoglycan DD-metalloendopeptidase family protein [Patescibacteria group bacterium]MCL5431984.1 peptidoglycan DD-metalloendopeptidase family protein [Patescibacteria group bacterium]
MAENEPAIVLSWNDVLLLALKWEQDPKAPTNSFVEKDVEMEVPRDAEISKVEQLLGEKPKEFFDHADGWQQARLVVLDQIEKDLKNGQPTKQDLDQLDEDRKKTTNRRKSWNDNFKKWYQEFANQRGKNTTDAREIAANAADQIVRDDIIREEQTANGPDQQRAPISRKITYQPAVQMARQVVEAPINLARPAGGWRTEVRVFLRNPISWVRNLFWVPGKNAAADVAKKTAEKAAQKAVTKSVAKGAKKVAKEVTKKAVKEVASDALEGLIALIPGGQAVAAALEVAKRVWGAVKAVWNRIPQPIRDALKKLAFGASLAVGYLLSFFLSHGLATTLMLLASPFGPAAMTAAFITGLGIETIIPSIISGLSSGAAAISAFSSAALAGLSLSFVAPLVVVLTPLLVGVAALLIILLPAQATEGQEAKITFKLEQTADPAEISSYSDNANITYTLTVTTPVENVTVSRVEYQLTSVGKGDRPPMVRGTLTGGTTTPDTPLRLTYTVTINDPRFNDSVLLNTINVTGKGENEPADETESITTKVTIGSPKIKPPFGYPASGKISSLDLEPVKCVNNSDPNDKVDPQRDADGKPISCPASYHEEDHCGTFLDLFGWGRTCSSHSKGGMDIAGPQTTVYSTVDGVVIKSAFDTGPTTATCTPLLSPTGFCYPALGGVVYIRSLDNSYIVAYLHLANDGLPAQNLDETKNVIVKRGDPIGETYSGQICGGLGASQCTTTGTHVHYQILLYPNLTNDYFTDPNNIGTCQTGAILDQMPFLGEIINDAQSSISLCE